MKIGVIGGSGLYDIEGMEKIDSVVVDTPFGEPSDPYIHGMIAGRDVFFLPRHGKGHRIMPSEINHRANIFGFKTLGVDCVLSISAVGSLREELRPRDIVLPDQYSTVIGYFLGDTTDAFFGLTSRRVFPKRSVTL